MRDDAIRVLLIEDSASDVLLIRADLDADRMANFEVHVAERLAAGLAAQAAAPCDAALLDLGLPDSQGFATFQTMHAAYPHLPIVILSGLANEELARRAVQHGAQDYVVKGSAMMPVLGHLLRYAIERQESRRQQMAHERRWRTLIEQSADAIALTDAQGVIQYQSPAAARILGYTMEEMIGHAGRGLLYPDDQEWAAAALAQAVANPRQPVLAEYRVRRSDGTVLWIESIITSWLDDPALDAVIFNYRDVTQRKRDQQQLEELNRTLEARVQERTAEVEDLYENAPCGYHSLDASGQISRINVTELEWLGYQREELVGRPFTSILTPVSRDLFAQRFPGFRATGRLSDAEFELVRKDGTLLAVSVTANAVYGPDGQYLNSRSTVVDISERKQAEAAMSFANAELARAMRVKDEFLANMSHELRTPLNSILAFAEALQEEVYGELNERQHKSLGNIASSGRHLLALINDLLDLSKIEAGRLELHWESVPVVEVCEASLMFVKETAVRKGIRISFAIDDPRAIVQADARRLKQMLVNLLSNAVKFTPAHGQVQLAVQVGHQQGIIEFSVKDTGPGIKREEQGRLFQPFTQLDTATTRTVEGTGLGLALVKRLATQHGGTVRVESTGVPGEGSCFAITLPFDAVARDTAARQPGCSVPAGIQSLAAPPGQARVLLIEDDEMAISVTEAFLSVLGYQLSIASSGQEGVKLAHEHRPDVLLLDIHLPDLDGIEVMRRLRTAPHFAATPIIAITAFAMDGDRERCLQAGASHYLSKPFSLRELAALMQRLLLERRT